MPATAGAIGSQSVASQRASDGGSMSAAGLLATGATLCGLLGACSFLLQARKMARSRRSQDVSLGFLGTITGGYLLWLLYGLAITDIPLIVVDGAGLACASATFVLALRLRGQLLTQRERRFRARRNSLARGRGLSWWPKYGLRGLTR